MGERKPRNQNKEYHVPALEKGLSILEHLSAHGARNLNQICAELGISRTTAFSTLKNLESLGYLTHEGGMYRPSYKLFSLGMQVQRQNPDADRIFSEVCALRDTLQHTVHFSTFVGNSSLLLYRVDGPGVVQFLSFVGEMKPLHFSGVGKAILAYLPQNRFDAYASGPLAVSTERTMSTAAQLQAFRKNTRRCGYAIDDEEGELGVFCVAVPVFVTGGEIYAGMSVSMLKSSPSARNIDDCAKKMLLAGAKISRKLGYTGPYPLLDA